METRLNERTVYLNGEFLPESRALLSFRDAGFVYGDAVFDTARTFNGVLFRLRNHVDRLFSSLAYCRIAIGMDRDEIAEVTEQVVARNRPLLGPNEDYWVSQRISSGPVPLDGEPPIQDGPTVVIECTPLPLRARAPMFRDGIDAVTAPLKRIPPDALSPNAKMNNYMNAVLSQREVSAIHPGAWALQLDRNGNIAEGIGCNVFFVIDGVIHTPREEFILPGVTRAVVIDLARKSGFEVVETDVSLHRASIATEAFFTSTSLCVCPLRSLNGRSYLGLAGPVAKQLMALFSDEVGMDFAAQYLAHLRDGSAKTGF
ncbi:MAG: aminotransferase class IV [Alphaproteobacteria bacterium]